MHTITLLTILLGTSALARPGATIFQPVEGLFSCDTNVKQFSSTTYEVRDTRVCNKKALLELLTCKKEGNDCISQSNQNCVRSDKFPDDVVCEGKTAFTNFLDCLAGKGHVCTKSK